VTDLHYVSATEILQAFNARELSPVEVFDAVAARADAVEPRINALLERDVEASRAEAVAAQERYASRAPRGVLDGLPIVTKEVQPIAGRPMRLGSVLTQGLVGPATHPVIERALDAGAIIHARTTTPEFSCSGFTHSTLWGETRNPWNLDYSPGGSSGGSAASLASGTAYLATGSDIGGSIRIPASFCGVVGFKAPYGRVPTLPPRTLDTYVVHGALARTVSDTALLHNVISGQHRVDHVSLPKVEIPL
jgi:aspartyl-tRNA(Asn)/glutamyl-tRNA(Gln) amidotransferase subunit A